MDAFAFESQFLDHLAPVWNALPEEARGWFFVDPALSLRAIEKGISEFVPTVRPDWTSETPPRFDGKLALVASYGDTKVARRLGYGPFAFLEHGAGQTYPGPNGSYSGGPDRHDVELVLVPSESCAAIWRKAYPNVRAVVVGCPKLDSLPRKEDDSGQAQTSHAGSSTVDGITPIVAVSFHWPLPLSISGYGNALPDYIRALPALAKRFNVIGHAHPKGDWPATMRGVYARAGIPFVAEFEDVCRQADVFVADNTSCLPEFAATGRPVVLLNARLWSRKHSFGGRFWDWAHLGINVWPDHDLPAAIEEALEDAPARRTAREDALGLVYGIRQGGAQVAAAAIVDWLAARKRVAA